MPLIRSSGTLTPAGAAYNTRPAGVSRYRLGNVSAATIWRTQPNVRTVIDFLARNLASLGAPRLYARTSATERRELSDHPLARLLARPNPNPKISGAYFWLAFFADRLLFDNALALMAKLPAGDAVALLRMPPLAWEPIGPDTPVKYRRLGGTPLEYDAGNVLHSHGWAPEHDSWGTSPIDTLKTILDEDIAANRWRAQFWQNAAQNSGYISRPATAPRWSDPARENFLDSWRDRYAAGGNDAGGTPLLEEGMEYHRDAFDFGAAQYLEARKLTRDEVTLAYHITPALYTGSEAGQASARRGLYADSLGPLVDLVASDLAAQLLPEFPDLDRATTYIEWNLEAKLRGHFSEQAEVISRSVGGPWLLRNEARAMFNRPPVPGGDDLIVPLNVTTGGRANPADTAPGTPGLGQASRGNTPRKYDQFHAKSRDGLRTELQPWADTHTTALAAYRSRNAQSVLSRLGAGRSLADAFDRARWDAELADDLAGVALALAPEVAAATLETIGYDPDDIADTWSIDGAEAWLTTNAAAAGAAFNTHVLGRLEAALEPADTIATEAAQAIYDDLDTYADAFAVTRTTTVANFTAIDAATAGGATTKTWRTHSANPRASHSALAGTTVDVDATFSNGARYPGDPSVGAEESANCTCSVTYGTT